MRQVSYTLELDKLEEQLVRHEDIKLKLYPDSLGIWTIGVGRNIQERGISKDEAIILMKNDIRAVMSELEDAMNAIDIHPRTGGMVRAYARINMAFNLGVPRLMGFRKMWSATKKEDWETAAKEMLYSKWAKQVGNRAVELAEQMRTGEWQE